MPAILIRRPIEENLTPDHVVAAIVARAGVDLVSLAPEHRRQDFERLAEEAEQLPVSGVDLCRLCLVAARRPVPDDREELIHRAVTSGDAAEIFTTSVNTIVLSAFSGANDSTDGWISESLCSTFRELERPLVQPAALEPLPRGQRATTAEFNAEGEGYKIARYAKSWRQDAQDLLDDYHHALNAIPKEIARAARRLRQDIAMSVLLANASLDDGGALFNATATTTAGGHANLGTGALNFGNFAAAVAAMRSQRLNTKALNVAPRALLVPPTLETTALEIAEKRGRLSDLLIRVDDRLSAAGVTDPASGQEYTGSASNWFLSASPADAPTVEVTYLDSTGPVPVVRGRPSGQGQWGFDFDVKYDIGAKALSYIGLYKSSGNGQ